MYSSKEMLADFDKAFASMMESFMDKWGDYIGDSEDLEALMQNGFNHWVDKSDWFEH